MKSIAFICSLCSLCSLGVSLFAQAPPNTNPPDKAAPHRPVARTPRPSPGLMNPALAKAKAPDVYKVAVTTTKGNVVIEVHRDWAPNGADRFYNLARAGYFNGDAIFRVIPGFVAQFGLNPNPDVSKVWSTANIKDDPVKQSNKKGTVTFAAASMPNSRSTQVFFNLADNTQLDASGFAPIGTVVEGMDVVLTFYSGYGDTPDQGQVMAQGKAYLDKNFSQLDSITTARVETPAVAKPPAARPAAAKPSTAKPAAPPVKK